MASNVRLPQSVALAIHACMEDVVRTLDLASTALAHLTMLASVVNMSTMPVKPMLARMVLHALTMVQTTLVSAHLVTQARKNLFSYASVII